MATAAMAPVAMIRNKAQPYRKAGNVPNASRKYTYVPPARGRRAPSSAYTKPPMMATMAPMPHAARVSGAVPTRWATTDGDRKMPEPMMPPTTSMVPENRPRRAA